MVYTLTGIYKPSVHRACILNFHHVVTLLTHQHWWLKIIFFSWLETYFCFRIESPLCLWRWRTVFGHLSCLRSGLQGILLNKRSSWVSCELTLADQGLSPMILQIHPPFWWHLSSQMQSMSSVADGERIWDVGHFVGWVHGSVCGTHTMPARTAP